MSRVVDPLANSSWSAPGTVEGFRRSAPNPVLLQFAQEELRRAAGGRALDIGCGAGRNAVPLATMGWDVVGVDLSWSMLAAAAERGREAGARRLRLVMAPMERMPVADRMFDLVVAHGIWNLARSSAQFRQAVRDAARAAKPGAALFVFTFSRNTLPADARPLADEPFVFTHFSGEPQCFLTEDELVAELGNAGFVREPGVPIREYNRRRPGAVLAGSAPVIYEGTFRRSGTPITKLGRPNTNVVG